MRRVVSLGALVTALALCSTPVAAQTDTPRWFANASVGSAVGTVDPTATINSSAGWSLGRGLALVADFGMFESEPFEDRRGPVNPTLGIPASNTEGTAFHLNGNLQYRMPERARVTPYVTAGVGTFVSPLLVNAPFGRSELEFDHDPQLAGNVGGGLTVRINRWIGVSADHRYFAINAKELEHVNRFAAGVALLIK